MICVRSAKFGSTRTGYESSASMEPKFDSENSQYGGDDFAFERESHDCTNGFVAESRMKGKPMVLKSRPRIKSSGFSVPSGLKRSAGKIGMKTRLMTSSATCTRICHAGATFSDKRCA